MLKENYLLNKLNAGSPVLGTWATIPSVVTADILASSGLDFIIIDREHGPITFETAQAMSIACESRKVSAVMRVGDVDKAFIQNALDIGVHGVQVPNIINRDEAEKVVYFSKYPPIGDRGFSPFTRAGGYSMENSRLLVEKANSNTLVILNVEGVEAIQNIDQILALDGVDVIFVGLFDLSKALGIPGDVGNPRLLEFLSRIIQRANYHGKFVGTIATTPENLEYFVKIGVMYLVYSVDCHVMRSAYASLIDIIKRD